MEIKESLCESCVDLCGDEVDCRVWVYKVKNTMFLKAMIIDAILREVYSNKKAHSNDIVDRKHINYRKNLRRF